MPHADPEQFKQYQREYRNNPKNKAKKSENSKKYRASKGEELLRKKREYYAKTAELDKKNSKKWAEENPERSRAIKRKSYLKNKEKQREAAELFRKTPEGKASRVMEAAARRKGVKARTPDWFDKNAVKTIYLKAQHLTEATGELYEVDHIVPLFAKRASGLHTVENLQIIHHRLNRKKSNKYKP